jgi:hypothetical protein
VKITPTKIIDFVLWTFAIIVLIGSVTSIIAVAIGIL